MNRATHLSFLLPRRRFLAGAAALACINPGRSRAAEVAGDIRLVSLSWAVSETLYALGVAPVGAAETSLYDIVIGQPPTPSATSDIGLQGAPNLEYLAQLAPDVMIIQSWQEDLRPALQRCGKVETITIYADGGNAFDNACAATQQLGTIAGVPAKAGDWIAAASDRLADLRQRLRGVGQSRLILAQMIDDANLTVFTRGGLFDATLMRLGLSNAWAGAPTLLWGGAVVGLEEIATLPDTTLILIASPGLAPDETLTRSRLWTALPSVRSGHCHHLDSFWGFGALPTAIRFAEALTDAIG